MASDQQNAAPSSRAVEEGFSAPAECGRRILLDLYDRPYRPLPSLVRVFDRFSFVDHLGEILEILRVRKRTKYVKWREELHRATTACSVVGQVLKVDTREFDEALDLVKSCFVATGTIRQEIEALQKDRNGWRDEDVLAWKTRFKLRFGTVAQLASIFRKGLVFVAGTSVAAFFRNEIALGVHNVLAWLMQHKWLWILVLLATVATAFNIAQTAGGEFIRALRKRGRRMWSGVRASLQYRSAFACPA